MKSTPLLLLSSLAFVATGCSDILEKDLTGYGVVLVSPPDGHTTSANLVTFRWEAVPEANNYRLQLATPDFLNPVSFILDTLVSSTTFSTPLSPGSYHWRVRAEHPNSHTDYYERTLIVTAASSLTGLTPILVQPTNNLATNAEPLSFAWETLDGADDYRFELREGSQTGSVVLAQILADTEVDLIDVAEGTYAWGVQAQNATSTSSFSYRTIRVDRTVPSAPALLAPVANAMLPNMPFNFQWTSGMDALTTTMDSLIVVDSTSLPIRQLLATTTTYADSLGIGTYTWYVRTIDEAGNGTSSVVRALTIQ